MENIISPSQGFKWFEQISFQKKKKKSEVEEGHTMI